MKHYIIPTIIFTVIFMFIPSNNLTWLPNVQPVWIWNKAGGYGTKPFLTEEDPTDHLSGYKIPGAFFSFASKKFYTYGGDSTIEYSLLGEGFFEYKKLGDEISYYNEWKELFWKKSYSSYPRPGFFSNIIPLVSGDGNTVFFADRNGNSIGVGSIDGRFAVDICYASSAEIVFVLFSGGEFIIIDDKANPLTEYKKEDIRNHNKSYFAKSCSISPNGSYYAIHYQEGEVDKISIQSKNKKWGVIEFEKIIPQKIHFSLDNDGNILIPFSDQVSIYNKRGKIIHSSNQELEEYYNPSFVVDSYFLWGNKDRLVIWNSEGEEVHRFHLTQSDFSFRFIPGANRTFYLETKNDIRQFVFIN